MTFRIHGIHLSFSTSRQIMHNCIFFNQQKNHQQEQNKIRSYFTPVYCMLTPKNSKMKRFYPMWHFFCFILKNIVVYIRKKSRALIRRNQP
ncbi:MAG: hypothetical protein B6I22_12205 [Desulfobacteraceae bacterium 4572_123]|nr:MAG: hypothetical protein B6I22_12205 [Desulfobacteraceae bacterium 4572_123]